MKAHTYIAPHCTSSRQKPLRLPFQGPKQTHLRRCGNGVGLHDGQVARQVQREPRVLPARRGRQHTHLMMLFAGCCGAAAHALPPRRRAAAPA